MLDVHQCAELHDHLARSMVRVADVLRSRSPVSHVADAAARLLLDRAVIVVAEQRAANIPSLAQPSALDVGVTRPRLGGTLDRLLQRPGDLVIEGILLAGLRRVP
jgi:hypothetical protein